MPEEMRTVNLNLGNAAETNMVAINATHISHVRLVGSISSDSRRMEIHMTSGSIIGMNFDDPARSEEVFEVVMDAINKTIPDHVRGTTLHIPQPPGSG